MNKPSAAVRANGPCLVDTVFVGGCTAVFLTIVAGLAGMVSLYLR
jgi:hypothetical protein